jgi:nucleoside-diphosphate-sugar epimerase
VTPYGRSKLQSERVVAGTAGLSWMILRPGVVYGPGDRAMLPLFRLARRGVLPLIGRSDAAYTVVYISDAVRAIEAALSSDLDGETVFVGHPKPATVRQILEGVRSAVGRTAATIPISLGVTRAAALVGDLVGTIIGRPLPLNRGRYLELAAEGFVCRVDRLRDCLGVVAEIGLGNGLAETAAWYRRAGWI